MSADAYRQLVAQLFASLELGAPDEGDEGHSVVFDGRVAVELRYDEAAQSLVLFSALGTLDDAQRTALAAQFLDANVFWRGTGGATLGVSSSGLAVICEREPVASLDLPKLRSTLEAFVNRAEMWKHLVERAGTRVAPEPAKPPVDTGALRV